MKINNGFLFLMLPLILFASMLSQAQMQTRSMDYYVNNGLINSPLLKDLQNQSRTNAIDSLLVLAAKKPQLTGTSQLMAAPVFNDFGYDEAITNGGNYSALIGISQTLFGKKNIQNQLDNVEIQRKSLLLTTKLTEDDLKKRIIAQYITTWSDYQGITNAQEQIKAITEQEIVLKQLVERGLYKQSDYLSLKIEMQSMEIDRNQQFEQYRLDQYMLNLICGLGDTAIVNLEKPSIKAKENPEPWTFPFFVQFRIDSLKNSLSRTSVDVRYLPKVNWFGDAGYNSSGQLHMEKNFGFSAGINLSVPIYDGNQRKKEYQKISINEETRRNYEDHFIKQYKQRTLQIQRMIQSKEEITGQNRQKIKLLNELIDFDKHQLEAGNLAFTDYLIAFRSLLESAKTIANLESDRLQLINELNFITLP